MRRDMDLVRAILERVREFPLEGGAVHDIDNWTEDDIIHHLDVLQDGGYLVRRGRLEVARLTWAGHELYDSLPAVEPYSP